MSADNYWVIRKSPHDGKFMPVMGFASEESGPTDDDWFPESTYAAPTFDTVDAALKYAEESGSEYGVIIHPECGAITVSPFDNGGTQQQTRTNAGYGQRTAFDFKDDGVLWAINRTLFHPRGFALAEVTSDEGVVSFVLLGDGQEPWCMPNDHVEDEKFEAFEELLQRARES